MMELMLIFQSYEKKKTLLYIKVVKKLVMVDNLGHLDKKIY